MNRRELLEGTAGALDALRALHRAQPEAVNQCISASAVASAVLMETVGKHCADPHCQCFAMRFEALVSLLGLGALSAAIRGDAK